MPRKRFGEFYQLFVILYTLSIYPSVHKQMIRTLRTLFEAYLVYRPFRVIKIQKVPIIYRPPPCYALVYLPRQIAFTLTRSKNNLLSEKKVSRLKNFKNVCKGKGGGEGLPKILHIKVNL